MGGGPEACCLPWGPGCWGSLPPGRGPPGGAARGPFPAALLRHRTAGQSRCAPQWARRLLLPRGLPHSGAPSAPPPPFCLGDRAKCRSPAPPPPGDGAQGASAPPTALLTSALVFQDSHWQELLEALHRLPLPEPGTSVHLSVVSTGWGWEVPGRAGGSPCSPDSVQAAGRGGVCAGLLAWGLRVQPGPSPSAPLCPAALVLHRARLQGPPQHPGKREYALEGLLLPSSRGAAPAAGLALWPRCPVARAAALAWLEASWSLPSDRFPRGEGEAALGTPPSVPPRQCLGGAAVTLGRLLQSPRSSANPHESVQAFSPGCWLRLAPPPPGGFPSSRRSLRPGQRTHAAAALAPGCGQGLLGPPGRCQGKGTEQRKSGLIRGAQACPGGSLGALRALAVSLLPPPLCWELGLGASCCGAWSEGPLGWRWGSPCSPPPVSSQAWV